MVSLEIKDQTFIIHCGSCNNLSLFLFLCIEKLEPLSNKSNESRIKCFEASLDLFQNINILTLGSGYFIIS